MSRPLVRFRVSFLVVPCLTTGETKAAVVVLVGWGRNLINDRSSRVSGKAVEMVGQKRVEAVS